MPPHTLAKAAFFCIHSYRLQILILLPFTIAKGICLINLSANTIITDRSRGAPDATPFPTGPISFVFAGAVCYKVPFVKKDQETVRSNTSDRDPSVTSKNRMRAIAILSLYLSIENATGLSC